VPSPQDVIAKWEPPPGLLRDYEELWEPTTDAPRVYHIACALSVVATVLEHRVWLPFGGDRIFPNLWILLLGPSSFYRKSTCISKARKTIGNVFAPSSDDDARSPILPDEFSRESLLKHLSQRGQGILTYSEFSGALAAFGRDYMSGTKETLADLYDGPERYTRLVGGQTYTINNACLGILGASQTDWFLEKLRAGDVRGGFLARFSFWPATYKPRFLALPSEPSPAIKTKLTRGLQQLRAVKGPITVPADVLTDYTAWVQRHERELDGVARAGDLSPFWSRLSIMVWKFAIVIQTSRDFSTILTTDTLRRAIALVEFLKASLRFLFEEEFAFGKDMQARQKVLRLIASRPAGITHRDLLRASSLLSRDLAPVLDTLKAEERVVMHDKRYFAAESSALSAPVSSAVTDTGTARFHRVK
jgi:hypothetical protein